MLVLCVIFALLTLGFVVPCVIDIASTPERYFDLPTKQTWLMVAIAFWVFGAAAWLLVGRRDVRAERVLDTPAALWATGGGLVLGPRAARAGAGRGWRPGVGTRARFVAPDDNPEFLLELDRRIRRLRDQE